VGLRKLLVTADLIVSILQKGTSAAEPTTKLPDDVDILDVRFVRFRGTSPVVQLLLRSSSWAGSNGLAGGLDQAEPIVMEFRRRERFDATELDALRYAVDDYQSCLEASMPGQGEYDRMKRVSAVLARMAGV